MSEPTTPDPAVGLLEQIADTALDDDYYVVRSDSDGETREFNTILTGVVLAVFALLVAIAAIQTKSDRPATERERETLISDVDARKARLASRDATAKRLRAEVDELKSAVVVFDPAYQDLRVLTADRAATGPGVRVRLDSGTILPETITDQDLQRIVNGLWYAGAEAIAVNGKRIGSLSSIRTAAGVMKVNYAPIGPPYEIIALGDPDSLKDRFTETPIGRNLADRDERRRVIFDVTGSDDLHVDAAPKSRLTIAHAKALKEDP